MKEPLEALQTRRPEPEQSRTEVSRLRKADRELRSEHAAELRELKGALAAYTNQNQALTLRNVQPQGHNSCLPERLRYSGENVVVLPTPDCPRPDRRLT